MNPDKFVRWVKKEVSNLSLNNIRRKLRLLGFKYKSGGGYKMVYVHPEYESFVVKVYRCEDGWTEDSYEIPKIIEKYYIKPFYNNKKFIIQKKVSNIGHRKARNFFINHEYFEMFENHDVMGTNVAWYKNKPVIIDFIS